MKVVLSLSGSITLAFLLNSCLIKPLLPLAPNCCSYLKMASSCVMNSIFMSFMHHLGLLVREEEIELVDDKLVFLTSSHL